MDKTWKDSKGELHSGHCIGIKDEYNVIECMQCGFKHITPIPTKEFLSEYYKNEFIKKRLDKVTADKFYKKMADDYIWLDIFYNEKYDFFEKYIKREKRSIIDIGSGLGFFLRSGNVRNWKTFGIEPSIEAYNYSKENGCNVANEYLDETNYQSFGKFDIVHMHEVIEHLPDPLNMIKISKRMLNEDGLICIVSPNDFNPFQEAFIKYNEVDKWWIAPPEHINYFDFESIEKLLINNGFSILERTSTFPLELFLLMGDNYIGNNEIGSKIHHKRKHFELALMDAGCEQLRRELYKKFSRLGLGREFIIIAKLNQI